MRDLIDLQHLDEQTFGDEQLRADVLGMFQTQTPILVEALNAAEGSARSDIAHRLKGSCLAIGAIHLAEVAAKIEVAPSTIMDVHAISEATLAEVAKILKR